MTRTLASHDSYGERSRPALISLHEAPATQRVAGAGAARQPRAASFVYRDCGLGRSPRPLSTSFPSGEWSEARPTHLTGS